MSIYSTCRLQRLRHNLCLQLTLLPTCFSFFFFNDTATTEIYTLSLHDALPIYRLYPQALGEMLESDNYEVALVPRGEWVHIDRKSTRLNSSHSQISYAVFCLKKKKKTVQYYIAKTFI